MSLMVQPVFPALGKGKQEGQKPNSIFCFIVSVSWPEIQGSENSWQPDTEGACMRSICEPLQAQVEWAGLVWRRMAMAGGGHLKPGSVDPYDSAFPSSLDRLGGGACPHLSLSVHL